MESQFYQINFSAGSESSFKDGQVVENVPQKLDSSEEISHILFDEYFESPLLLNSQDYIS